VTITPLRDRNCFCVEPVTGALGAEITGLNLSKPLDDESVSALKDAFHEHLVLFFRDQIITLEQQKIFARHFGDLELNNYIGTLEGHPEVIEVIKEPEEEFNFGDNWHIDQTHFEKPILGSTLYARDVPPFGGDTQWANMYLAYETLSAPIKTLIDGLTCVHVQAGSAYKRGLQAMRLKPVVVPAVAEHPLVRTHPATGKRSLFLPRAGVGTLKELNVAESNSLMNLLQAHAENPDFACRFHWQKNSLALWDNRCTRHRVTADYFNTLRGNKPHRRHMIRISIVGDRPV
jgi:taurine dioxygenase